MDKTSWIVSTLCVATLIGHFYFSNEESKARLAQRNAQIAAEQVEAAKNPAAAPAVVGTNANPQAVGAPVSKGEIVHALATEKARFEFTSLGGGVQRVIVSPKSGHDEFKVELNHLGKAAIGSISRGIDLYEPLVYQVIEKDDRHIVFEGITAEKLKVRKTYRLSAEPRRDDYLLQVSIVIVNEGDAPFQSADLYLYSGASGSQLSESGFPPSFYWNNSGDETQRLSSYFTGGMFSSAKGPDLQQLSQLRWAGSMNRFYAILLCNKDYQPGKIWANRFQFSDPGIDKGALLDAMHGGVGLPAVTLQPKAQQTFEYEFYLGPKEYSRLKHLDQGNDQHGYWKVMFYGWFGWVSRAMMNLMGIFHSWVGNWGWAILMMTMVIRAILWPLHAKSTRTMKRMALLAPMMTELKEKHKDEPQKVQMETMKLYKEYGINPFGGCLPMLLQMPIFIGFFSLLGSAAELRGETWFWVRDLSMPDTVAHIFGFPLNPLPLLMTATMFIQMQFAPQSGDKTQQMIFKFMPILFLLFCYNYASGLALYWTMQNIISIFQTIYMKRVDPPMLQKVVPSNKPGKPGGGFMERLRKQLEEAQKAQEIAAANPKQGPKKKG